jgi:O-antigen ligase
MTAPGGCSLQQASPLQKLGFTILLFFLFLLHSRILDLVLSTFHIPILSLYSSVAAAFLSGGLVRALAHRLGAVWLAFTLWMIFAVPFSVWPGGAMHYTQLWLKVVLIYFVIVGLIGDFGQFRRAIQAIAFAIFVLSLLTIPFGEMSNGRLVLARGRFENPNDLAQILLMALPLWWFIAHDAQLSRVRRSGAYMAMIPIFWAMARTGSRGALIAALVVGLILFLRSSMTQKIQVAGGGAILLIAAALLLPGVIKGRYFTFLSADDTPQESALEQQVEDSAVTSTLGRWHMLQDSIAITLRHPLFGVGAGQFVVAQDIYAREVQHLKKGSWQVTHNTYTEVSSETGLPGLLFYTLALIFTFRTARLPVRFRTRRLPPELAELVSASFCLRLSTLAFAVSALFASLAYQTQLVTLAALAVVLSRTSRPILDSWARAPRGSEPALAQASVAHNATLRLAHGGALKCAGSQDL